MRSTTRQFDDSQAVLFDLETRSTVDLKRVGSRVYARHPSTVVLTLVALIDGVYHCWANARAWNRSEPMGFRKTFAPTELPAEYGNPKHQIYYQDQMPAPIVEAVKAGKVFVAHNCIGFDSLVWAAKLKPVPTDWFDMIYLVRANGLPGSLDQASQRIGLPGKHEANRLLKQVFAQENEDEPVTGSDARRATLPRKKVQRIENLIGLARPTLLYNLCDVILMKELWVALAGQDLEDRLIAAHEAINDRGIVFDYDLAKQLADLAHWSSERAADQIAELTGGKLVKLPQDREPDYKPTTPLRSIKQMKSWLASQGLKTLPNLRRETIRRFLDNPETMLSDDGSRVIEDVTSIDPMVSTVLKLRMSALRITGLKLDRAIAVSRDMQTTTPVLHDLLIYHGAHTGRFTSHLVQVHNLPRPVNGVDVEQLSGAQLMTPAGPAPIIVNAVAEIQKKLPWATLDDVLSSLIRCTLVPAPGNLMTIGDFTSVECRGLAWCAGEGKLLDIFRNQGDVYCSFGSILYGRPITKKDEVERQVSKATVLGCGYGLGAEKFACYAANAGVDLAAAGVTAEQCILFYRNTYVLVPQLWRDLETAALDAVRHPGHVNQAGRCLWAMEGPHLICQLPSGRKIVYRDATIEEKTPAWAIARGEKVTKPTVVFNGPRGPSTQYGGKWAENIVQAICRDLLCEALIRCEEAGLCPVLHVHDEIVCQVPAQKVEQRLHDMLVIMSTPPAWAAGFPLGVEGFWNERYAKKPFGGRAEVRYYLGEEV
jgi:DNA polymerase